MANCSQINNATIKGTSTVIYDSTQLPCTDVNTCDNLNIVLAKFDSVICAAVASVATLTEDITNLTEDVMIITEEISGINDQLGICCPTTTTTTIAPTTTTSTTSAAPTTTTTSSSTSSTTSTTTTLVPATTTTTTSISITTTTTITPTTTTTTSNSLGSCMNYEINPPVLNPGTFHTVGYLDCLGNRQEVSVPDGGSMVTICATEIVSDNNNGLTIALFTICLT